MVARRRGDGAGVTVKDCGEDPDGVELLIMEGIRARSLAVVCHSSAGDPAGRVKSAQSQLLGQCAISK